MRAKIKKDGILLRGTPDEVTSYDVFLAGIRVWSFTSKKRHRRRFREWPVRLAERLHGFSDVRVELSRTGEVLAEKRVRFDSANEYFRLEREDGTPLMLNKWLRLAPMLATDDGRDLREDLVVELKALESALKELGHTVFAVGGTALGPYRDGDFFPHDDDGDLAVFFDADYQGDVSLAMMQLARDLTQLGYRARAHSHAHLQVYPPAATTHGLYIDVFAAFFKDGMINQPFHVRGPFEYDDLFPLQKVSVRGETFDIPNNAEKWFVTNYDENWATPIPGFKIKTPRQTSRRFKSWFGTYNIHRHYWDAYARDGVGENDYSRLDRYQDESERVGFKSRHILNFGPGPNPSLPSNINTVENPTIWALDYSDEIRATAEDWAANHPEVDIRVVDLNANNYHAMLDFVRRLPKESFDLYLGFLLEGQTDKRRQASVWRLIRMALLSGGTVVADYVTEPVLNVKRSEPRGWHLEPYEIVHEGAANGVVPFELFDGRIQINQEERPYKRVSFELMDKAGATR